ncbi:hypothetical protein ACHAXR_002316 [Thalassiosira sp. AJA248-18]
MAMECSNGDLATNDDENMEVMQPTSNVSSTIIAQSISVPSTSSSNKAPCGASMIQSCRQNLTKLSTNSRMARLLD